MKVLTGEKATATMPTPSGQEMVERKDLVVAIIHTVARKQGRGDAARSQAGAELLQARIFLHAALRRCKRRNMLKPLESPAVFTLLASPKTVYRDGCITVGIENGWRYRNPLRLGARGRWTSAAGLPRRYLHLGLSQTFEPAPPRQHLRRHGDLVGQPQPPDPRQLLRARARAAGAAGGQRLWPLLLGPCDRAGPGGAARRHRHRAAAGRPLPAQAGQLPAGAGARRRCGEARRRHV